MIDWLSLWSSCQDLCSIYYDTSVIKMISGAQWIRKKINYQKYSQEDIPPDHGHGFPSNT